MRSNIILFLGALVLTAIIIHSWFSNGKILSNTSEESLSIFNTQKIARVYSSLWFPAGAGSKNIAYIQEYPTFLVLSKLGKLRIPPFLIQAILMGSIMVLGISFMYLLLQSIFQFNRFYAIFGSLFYLLNLYSMSSIWKRLLYNHYIVWAYLPLFLLSWIKWIDTGRIRWLALLIISSLIFSYTFAHPAFILTFWITAATFTFYKLWQARKVISKIRRIIIFSGVALLMWLVVNIWWTYPFLTFQGSYMENAAPSWDLNLSSLQGVSHYQDTKDILLLRQSWVFNKEHEWYWFYSNPLTYLISILILAIVVIGLVKSDSRLSYRGFVITLFILGWFISKGTNFPLGERFYSFLFTNFPQTAALRNPYEKFGPVYLIAYSILFVFGLFWLTEKIKSRRNKMLFLALSFVVFCGVLVYPMWNGAVFPSKDRVEVPTYYIDANNYLNSINSKRTFSIPFIFNGSNLIYNWGYVGGDPTNNIFDSDSVSVAGLPIFSGIDQKVPDLLNNQNFPKVLGMLGVDNLVLHRDIVFPSMNVASMSATVNNWKGVNKAENIGMLTIYSLDKKLVKPEVYAVDSLVNVNSSEEGIKQILNGQLDLNKSAFTKQFTNYDKSDSLPILSFKKISATSFEVNIQGATEPFLLILNDTFDPSWQLKIDGVAVSKHFNVNGFANGWYVTKQGDYSAKINLKVWPWE